MKTFRIIILTIICSLIFGLVGGYVFTGIYESYKDGEIRSPEAPIVTMVDYPKIESSNYEVVIEKSFDTFMLSIFKFRLSLTGLEDLVSGPIY